MATHRLRTALEHLHLALAPPEAPETDAHLLARFLTSRDESAFAALVRRHGPMVLGVCRRVLRHAQDAEDAFQATFLVLAKKAGSVLKRATVGTWLYVVAYRTAQRARARQARRGAREVQVDELPHPQVPPEEAQDWRPLLDSELSRLPEKYRAPVVLCDLQGRARKEVSRLLGLPPGTLSSRLATGRRLLAERLSRRGVALSGGALAVALSQASASAQVAAPLVTATAKAAVLVAAGHLAAVAAPVAVLTRGALRAMFLTKLKLVAGVVLVVAALGAGGLAFRGQSAGAAQAEKRSPGKPQTEAEALRKEIELLRLNLQVVLEKVQAQEAELRALRADKGKARAAASADQRYAELLHLAVRDRHIRLWDLAAVEQVREMAPDAIQGVEKALNAVRAAKDDAARRRAVEALERALQTLREELRKGRPDDPAGPARK
jgi:RNA polymerase sigma factor (sigma-70 family)